ncbi:MAG: hypothetical protein WA191_13225 [Telluria sp.]|nr:hypothetical protein [Telluria sp.]
MMFTQLVDFIELNFCLRIVHFVETRTNTGAAPVRRGLSTGLSTYFVDIGKKPEKSST